MTVAELTRALVEPNAAIAQGYATARVQLKDGRTLRGFVRNEGNHVLPLQTVDGRLVAVDKRTATITRETGSAMPPLKATADETRDLIAFLEPARRWQRVRRVRRVQRVRRCEAATGATVRMTSPRF